MHRNRPRPKHARPSAISWRVRRSTPRARSGRRVLLALNAVAATRDADGLVLPEALDALRRVTPPPGRFMPLPGHAAEVTRMAFSPTGAGSRLRATGCESRGPGGAGRDLRVDVACSIMEFSRDGRKVICPTATSSYAFHAETGKTLQSISNVVATGSRGREITQFVLSLTEADPWPATSARSPSFEGTLRQPPYRARTQFSVKTARCSRR